MKFFFEIDLAVVAVIVDVDVAPHHTALCPGADPVQKVLQGGDVEAVADQDLGLDQNKCIVRRKRTKYKMEIESTNKEAFDA